MFSNLKGCGAPEMVNEHVGVDKDVSHETIQLATVPLPWALSRT
jgi:hypothetical protein